MPCMRWWHFYIACLAPGGEKRHSDRAVLLIMRCRYEQILTVLMKKVLETAKEPHVFAPFHEVRQS